MPIYAYRCDVCGHTKDVLQKLNAAPPEACPACGAAAFRKQVTAAGFQLKGNGWYVTDFKGGASAKKPDDKADAAPATQEATNGDAKQADAKTDAKEGVASPGPSSQPSPQRKEAAKPSPQREEGAKPAAPAAE